MITTMAKIASVAGTDDEVVQLLLAVTAAEWRANDANVVGVVAEPHGFPDRSCGAGILRDIASGKAYPMFRGTVPNPDSCHLDAAGAADACAAILEQIASSALVVLNKFGMLEARGRGLAPAFAAAIAAGKPVLTTVSYRQRDSWRALAPEAVILAAEKTALNDWWQAVGPPARRSLARETGGGTPITSPAAPNSMSS
jgi:hypothetical protein